MKAHELTLDDHRKLVEQMYDAILEYNMSLCRILSAVDKALTNKKDERKNRETCKN